MYADKEYSYFKVVVLYIAHICTIYTIVFTKYTKMTKQIMTLVNWTEKICLPM